MPNVAVMVATVVIVVAFIKVLAAKINVVIQGVWAVIVAVLSCAGVWGYHIIQTSTAVDMTAIMLLGELIIAAVIGYKFLPDSIKEFELKNLNGTTINGK